MFLKKASFWNAALFRKFTEDISTSRLLHTLLRAERLTKVTVPPHWSKVQLFGMGQVEWWAVVPDLNPMKEGLSSIGKVVHLISSHNAVFLKITVVQAGFPSKVNWGRQKAESRSLVGSRGEIPWVSHTGSKCCRRCRETVGEGRDACTEGEYEAVEKPQETSLWVSAQTAVSGFKSLSVPWLLPQ